MTPERLKFFRELFLGLTFPNSMVNELLDEIERLQKVEKLAKEYLEFNIKVQISYQKSQHALDAVNYESELYELLGCKQ